MARQTAIAYLSSVNDIDALPDPDGELARVVLETVTAAAGTVVVVSATGEIDMLTETQLLHGLDEALGQPGATAVVIDLSGVTFFSSSGIAALATARATALHQNLTLQVVTPTESFTYRTLQLSGITELLTIYPTRATALGTHQPDIAPDTDGPTSTGPTTVDYEDPQDGTRQRALGQ